MKLNRNSGFALLLIVFGVLILFGKLGFIVGSLFGLILPIAMIALGYYGFRSGKKVLGGFVALVGIIILLGKLSGIIGFIIAAGLIIYGLSLLKKKSAY